MLVDDVPADDSQDTRKVCAEGVVSGLKFLFCMQIANWPLILPNV